MNTHTHGRSNACARAVFILLLVSVLGALQGSATAQLFVSTTSPPGPDVGSYDATTGAAIDADLVSGFSDYQGIAVLGNTLYLMLDGGVVGTFNATTGASINPTFITGVPLPYALEVSGNTLYIANYTADVIGTYDATTGATLDASFITTDDPVEMLVSNNTLYVSNTSLGTVSTFDATTGAAIDTSFITGQAIPIGLALQGNRLFVANRAFGGYVNEYDATTGDLVNYLYLVGMPGLSDIEILGDRLYAANTSAGTVGLYDITTATVIDASFISGLNGPTGLAFSVPAPSINSDLDDDGDVDSRDIDTLWNVIRPEVAGSDDPGGNDDEDLNEDGFVNEDDVDYMLKNLLTDGTNRQYGDADLDGGVGGLDYTAWRLRAGTGWANGDFDGDGGVGGLDYTLWRTRPPAYPTTVGPHSGGPQVVPEPASLALLALGAPMLLLGWRRRSARV